MGLVISRMVEKSYFLFINGEVKSGEYIKIKNIGLNKYNSNSVSSFIEAPDSIIILREEIVERECGLEGVIRQMKEGSFKLKNGKNG